MNKKVIGLGSNIGDRKNYLNQALKEIAKIAQVVQISNIYETPAMLPKNASEDWLRPFLNIAIEIKTSQQNPYVFLKQMQRIEQEMGRTISKRWAPRVIDLDILYWDGLQEHSSELTLPHPQIENRSFVLDPLADIENDFFKKARFHKNHMPLWMSIINLSPESFSQDGLSLQSKFIKRLDRDWEIGVSIFDLGAQSTRPGAIPLSTEEEWFRLQPFLEIFKEIFGPSTLRPRLSLDCYKPQVVSKCLVYGVDIINDVSGLTSPDMLEVLKNCEADYVLMHSLDVPTRSDHTLKGNVVEEVTAWFSKKLEILVQNHISLDRIIFDPGIGFGKNAYQSVELLRNIENFKQFPVKILLGHSRKSFLKKITQVGPSDRDLETLGVSLQMINQGVDILRVHNPEMHIRAARGWFHATS